MEPTTPPEIEPDTASAPSWTVLAIAAGCLIGGTMLLFLIRRAGASRFAVGDVPAPVIPPPEWDALPINVQSTLQYFSDAWEQRFEMQRGEMDRQRTELGVLRAALAGNGAVTASAPPVAPMAQPNGAAPIAATSMLAQIPDPQPQDPAATPAGPVVMASTRAAVSML